MTPAQHRAQAELLRKAGNEPLARESEMVAQMIERRQQIAPPPSATSPEPLSSR